MSKQAQKDFQDSYKKVNNDDDYNYVCIGSTSTDNTVKASPGKLRE